MPDPWTLLLLKLICERESAWMGHNPTASNVTDRRKAASDPGSAEAAGLSRAGVLSEKRHGTGEEMNDSRVERRQVIADGLKTGAQRVAAAIAKVVDRAATAPVKVAVPADLKLVTLERRVIRLFGPNDLRHAAGCRDDRPHDAPA